MLVSLLAWGIRMPFQCLARLYLGRNECCCIAQTVQAKQILSALALGHEMERSKHTAAAHRGSSKPVQDRIDREDEKALADVILACETGFF